MKNINCLDTLTISRSAIGLFCLTGASGSLSFLKQKKINSSGVGRLIIYEGWKKYQTIGLLAPEKLLISKKIFPKKEKNVKILIIEILWD